MTERLLVLLDMSGPWPGSGQPDPDGFSDVVTAALTEERRAAGGPLSQEDLRRHDAACIAIERIARRRGTAVATLSAQAIMGWQATGSAPARAAAGFHPPDAAPDWLRALSRHAQGEGGAILERAAQQLRARGHGVVLSPSPVPEGPLLAMPQPAEVTWHARGKPDPVAASAFRLTDPQWEPFAGSEPRKAAARRLWSQFAAAIEAGEPLPVGAGARHDVLAEALRVAVAITTRATSVRILYVDGSEAEPFPLPIMVPGRLAGDGPALRVGLMSMRHTTMDADVDGYWFRNRLVSTSRTHAETDAFCAAETVRKLADVYSAGIRRIELLQTGFEPAVLGFYRGLLRWLRATGADLVVQPEYLVRGPVRGTPWGN